MEVCKELREKTDEGGLVEGETEAKVWAASGAIIEPVAIGGFALRVGVGAPDDDRLEESAHRVGGVDGLEEGPFGDGAGHVIDFLSGGIGGGEGDGVARFDPRHRQGLDRGQVVAAGPSA